MNTIRWHVPEPDLARYARQELTRARLWSTEAHLVACAYCRERLADAVDPGPVAEGWARLDAELDAPRRGPVEAGLVRMGMADHTARLLAATPALRRSWLAAVAVTLLLGVIAGHTAQGPQVPLLFLGAAPVLPVAGVALSFGAGMDPTHEISLVAPMHTFRLLLLRTVSVLATTLTLTASASLALPSFGLRALAWLLPALALTALSLALIPRLGPVRAPSLVGAGWITVTVFSAGLSGGTPPPFTLAGQAVAAVTAITVAAVGVARRDRFDTGRSLDHPFTFRRMM